MNENEKKEKDNSHNEWMHEWQSLERRVECEKGLYHQITITIKITIKLLTGEISINYYYLRWIIPIRIWSPVGRRYSLLVLVSSFVIAHLF